MNIGIEQLQEKLDTQIEDKEKITYQQIEGKYQFKINQFGIVIEILKSKITLIVLMIMVIFVYIGKGNMKNKRKTRKEKREKYEANKTT